MKWGGRGTELKLLLEGGVESAGDMPGPSDGDKGSQADKLGSERGFFMLVYADGRTQVKAEQVALRPAAV